MRYQLYFWRRARGAVGQVVHGYQFMPLVGQVYHGVFPRPKNASPKRFLNGLSNPLHKKIKPTPRGISFISGGEQGIRTLEQVIARYTISNRAPSTSSDNSPYLQSNAQLLYTSRSKKSSVFLKILNYFL